MYTFEQTEKAETGLDVLVQRDGQSICWCYSIDDASNICHALNNIGRLEDYLSLIQTHSIDKWVTDKANEALNGKS